MGLFYLKVYKNANVFHVRKVSKEDDRFQGPLSTIYQRRSPGSHWLFITFSVIYQIKNLPIVTPLPPLL